MGGGEGVGVVRETGERVTGVKIGDWVIPAGPSLGTSLLTLSTPPIYKQNVCINI